MADREAAAPVSWVRHAWWSRWLTQFVKTRQPAVLLLSLPRSGSSWAGEALGCAADALYLREPVTQGDRLFHDLGTVFVIDKPDLDSRYRQLANKAYAGLPDFDHSVVRFPGAWAPSRRSTRRVVIKEVNPLACGWHIAHYAPRVVLLVRHPAAVALSWQGKGWLAPNAKSWAGNGEAQGRALRVALDALSRHAAHRVIAYEDLCTDPLDAFKSVYGFAGLTWDSRAEQFIREHTVLDGSPWDTSRNSQEMIHHWRTQVVPSHVNALHEAFAGFQLPWYRSAQDWALS